MNPNNTIGTTNIDALPIYGASASVGGGGGGGGAGGGGDNENIRMETRETQQQQTHNQNHNQLVDNALQNLQQQRDEDPAVKQRQMNQFVTGIQQASAAGMTHLPSRDIPQNQEHLVRDPQMQPSYVPPPIPQQTDYIRNYETTESIVRAQAQKQTKSDNLDHLYEQLQTPLLIGVLYFLFQLPVVKRTFFMYVPSLFHKDGNLNLGGYVCNSFMFSGIYFFLVACIKYMSV
jgi:hypothetical protein